MIVSPEVVQGIVNRKFTTKLLGKPGGYYRETKVEVEDERLLLYFPFDRDIVDEMKVSMEKRKWHEYVANDGRKVWSIPYTSQRNLFRLEVLRGKYGLQPYRLWKMKEDFDERIQTFCQNRHKPLTPYAHQRGMVNLGLNNHWTLFAAEMGTGKTLAAIILVEMLFEQLGHVPVYWLGSKSALVAARNEFDRWECRWRPTEMMTYEGLKKHLAEWPKGKPAPKILIADEFAAVKTCTAQRSLATLHLTNSMRAEHGWTNSYIIGMTGTPAPKTPSDWWMQIEVLCPGFLRENSVRNLRATLGHLVKEDSPTGGYEKLETWKDSSLKCLHCGKEAGHTNHSTSFEAMLGHDTKQTHERHPFKAGVNEVERLGRRLDGIVGVWHKKDCIDLPAKRYETLEIEPTKELLNIAKHVVDTTTRAVDALIKLRTLSDGFMYDEEPTGEFHECQGCSGKGQVLEYYEEGNEGDTLEYGEYTGGVRYVYSTCPEGMDPDEFVSEVIGTRPAIIHSKEVECYTCHGEGKLPDMRRIINEITCPKLDFLKELLEEHEEVGRLVVYAGFEGSIHRVRKTCNQQGWTVIKADGKGWEMTHPVHGPLAMTPENMVKTFQYDQENHPRVVFVGQPGAAGQGLTLTASPTTFFYSNDFNPMNRFQAEDRIHRIGMDTSRGGRIIDVVHLPSDRKIIESLRKSKHLQLMSMDAVRNLF